MSDIYDLQNLILGLSVSDGLWHQVCLAWGSVQGEYSIYKDGVSNHGGSGVSAGIPLNLQGTFYLGKVEDTQAYNM